MEALADERAAGVITGTDPYRELELYLQKVTVCLIKIFIIIPFLNCIFNHMLYIISGC